MLPKLEWLDLENWNGWIGKLEQHSEQSRAKVQHYMLFQTSNPAIPIGSFDLCPAVQYLLLLCSSV